MTEHEIRIEVGKLLMPPLSDEKLESAIQQTTEKIRLSGCPSMGRLLSTQACPELRTKEERQHIASCERCREILTVAVLSTPDADLKAPSEPVRQVDSPDKIYLWCKRLFDVTLAMGLLIILFPLLLLVGLAIVLEDGGPILYYQWRAGKNGEMFRYYKFRTMVKNAAAIRAQLAALAVRNEASNPIFKMKNDPRITRVGRVLRRYSLDELPQFVNILHGDMSLIGPRPHLPSEVELCTEQQRQRLLVKPGLVCLREVYGRTNLTFDQCVDLDLLYIQKSSLKTDWSILVKIVPAVFRGDSLYMDDMSVVTKLVDKERLEVQMRLQCPLEPDTFSSRVLGRVVPPAEWQKESPLIRDSSLVR